MVGALSGLPLAGPGGASTRRSMQLHLPKLAELQSVPLAVQSRTHVRSTGGTLILSHLLVRTFRGLAPHCDSWLRRNAPLTNVQDLGQYSRGAAPHMACRTWHLCLAI